MYLRREGLPEDHGTFVANVEKLKVLVMENGDVVVAGDEVVGVGGQLE